LAVVFVVGRGRHGPTHKKIERRFGRGTPKQPLKNGGETSTATQLKNKRGPKGGISTTKDNFCGTKEKKRPTKTRVRKGRKSETSR